jgi:hypothetical protein
MNPALVNENKSIKQLQPTNSVIYSWDCWSTVTHYHVRHNRRSRWLSKSEHLFYHLLRLQNLRIGVPMIWGQNQWWWLQPPLNVPKLVKFFSNITGLKRLHRFKHFQKEVKIFTSPSHHLCWRSAKLPRDTNNQQCSQASETQHLPHLPTNGLVLSARATRLQKTAVLISILSLALWQAVSL